MCNNKIKEEWWIVQTTTVISRCILVKILSMKCKIKAMSSATYTKPSSISTFKSKSDPTTKSIASVTTNSKRKETDLQSSIVSRCWIILKHRLKYLCRWKMKDLKIKILRKTMALWWIRIATVYLRVEI